MLQIGPHVGPLVGLRVGINNEWGQIYPETGAAFAGSTGITLDSLYTFQEASGNLLDKAGASNLNVNGAPTFAVQLSGRRGIYYDAVDERHVAQVYDPGVASLLAFGVCSFISVAGTGGVMGGYDATDALDGWLVYRNGAALELHVRSSATGSSLSVASTTALTVGRLYLVSAQVDRAANLARLRVTPLNGIGDAKTLDITGVGTLASGANHLYGFGSTPFLGPGVSAYYGGIKVGAGAAGASQLQTIHQRLGWE